MLYSPFFTIKFHSKAFPQTLQRMLWPRQSTLLHLILPYFICTLSKSSTLTRNYSSNMNKIINQYMSYYFFRVPSFAFILYMELKKIYKQGSLHPHIICICLLLVYCILWYFHKLYNINLQTKNDSNSVMCMAP